MWYSSQIPLPPSISRAVRAISNDFPQLLRLSIEIISGANLQKIKLKSERTNVKHKKTCESKF